MMKIERKALVEALSLLRKIADTKRQTLPVLATALIEPGHGAVVLSATNLEIGARLELEAAMDSGDDRRVLLPVEPLYKVVKAMPKDVREVTLSVAADHAVMVNSAKLIGMPPDDFPLVVPTDTPPVNVPGLLTALNKVSVAMSRDESRFALNGVLLSTRGDIVATDGHRLHVVHVGGLTSVVAQDTIAPSKLVEVLLGFKKLVVEAVAVSNEPTEPPKPPMTQIKVALSNGVLMSRAIEAEYPNYKAVIPKQHPYTLRASRGVLLGALAEASAVAEKRNRPVRIILDPEKPVLIAASSSELGETSIAVQGATWNGEQPMTIGFNADYIRDAVEAADSETVEIEMKDPLSPPVIRDGAYTAAFMPMRI